MEIEKNNFVYGMIAFFIIFCVFFLFFDNVHNYSSIAMSPMPVYQSIPISLILGWLMTFVFGVMFLDSGYDSESYLRPFHLGIFVSFIVIPAVFDFFLPWWLFIILALAIGEIVFWIDKKKPTKDRSKFWFTAERKAICIGISTVAVAIGMGVVNLIRWAIPWIEQYWEAIVVWFGYIGIGVGAILLFGFIAWCYIKLNSLKYRGKDKPYKGPEFRRKTIGNRNLKYGEIHNQLHRESKHHVHKIGYMAYTEEV